MRSAWTSIDLEGGGLQSMNVRYAALARRPTWAYGLWLGFPLGLHRWYLRERIGAIGQTVLTLMTGLVAWGAATLGATPWWSLIPAIALVGWAVFDLFWIRQRLVAVNKALRMALYLRRDAPRPNEAGVVPLVRYRDDETRDADRGAPDRDLLAEYRAIKERERGGHLRADDDAALRARTPKRVLSFNEQEALLRAQRTSRKAPRRPS